MSIVGKTSKLYSGFSPQSIPGCLLWLDAADSNTLTFSGSNIIQWNDKSGNGYHMNTRPNAGLWPIAGTSINGNRTVNFPSFNSGIKQATVINNFSTFFWVQRFISIPGNGFYFGADNSYDFHPGSGMASGFSPLPVQNASATAYTSTGVTSNTLINMQFPSGLHLFRCRGMTGDTRMQGLGYDRGDNARTIQADWAELILFTHELTIAQTLAVEGYLAQKWGIASYLPTRHAHQRIPPVLRTFTPLDLNVCALWLDAADSSTLTLSGSNITTWRDKSGNSRNAVGNLGTGTYNPTGMNSRPSVEITASGNMVVPIPPGTFSSGFAAFVVFQKTGGNNGFDTVISRIAPNGTQAPFDMYTYDPSTTARFTGNGTANLGSITSSSLARTTTPTIWFANVSPTLSNVWQESLNGTYATYTMTTNSGSYGDTASNVHIGTRADGATKMTGRISEIILYNVSSLTTTQRQYIEGYLSEKWELKTSLPSTHPFKLYRSLSLPFSPVQLGSCAVWLDANDSSTITLSGTTLTGWADKSGNGRTVTIDSAPTYSSNAFNNMPCMVFAAGNRLTSSTASALGQNATLAVVYRITTAGLAAMLGIGEVGSDCAIHWRDDFNTYSVYSQGGGTGNDFYKAININIASVAVMNTSTPYWVLTQNGNNKINPDIGGYNSTPSTITNSQVNIGSGTWASGLFRGYMCEAIVFSSSLNVGQRQQLEGYLTQKWKLDESLPSSHPFKSITI